ncbi:MAG: hypothetical protein JSV42_14080 [Chloroflexota bacterium]|nr:MAG: hypothetical protein JSV42_14080 [Chloroflexota bacterium]
MAFYIEFNCHHLLYLSTQKTMIADLNWKQLTITELQMAEKARRSGNEGRARVCARRAAGHVVGEYLRRQGFSLENESALQRIRYLESKISKDDIQKELLGHFLVHTTTEHELPIEADLLADVHSLSEQLLGEPLD